MYKRHIALASLLVWAAQCSLSVYGALPSVTVAATDPNATIGTTDPGVLTFSRTIGTTTGTGGNGGTTNSTSGGGTTNTTSGGGTTNSVSAVLTDRGSAADDAALSLPKVGDSKLQILSPNLIEVCAINPKGPDPATVTNWNLVNSSAQFVSPALSTLIVTVNGQAVAVQSLGFKRRPIYAPLVNYDLR